MTDVKTIHLKLTESQIQILKRRTKDAGLSSVNTLIRKTLVEHLNLPNNFIERGMYPREREGKAETPQQLEAALQKQARISPANAWQEAGGDEDWSDWESDLQEQMRREHEEYRPEDDDGS